MLPFSVLRRRRFRRSLVLLLLIVLAAIVVPLVFGAGAVQAARVPLGSGKYAYVTDNDPDHRLTASVHTARTDAPWVVVLHGGSWVHGTERNVANAARLFDEHGWQVFNVSYRLTHVTFGGQSRDLIAAVRWIRAHADRFGLDLHRGTAYGFSAGGQLAAWLGGTGWFRTVVSISGVLQPQRVADDARGARPRTEPSTATVTYLAAAERHIVGCPYTSRSASCRKSWRAFEPQYRLRDGGPATFIAQGEADPYVPPRTADAYAYWLARDHIAHQVIRVPHLKHTDSVLFASPTRQAQMLRFVLRHSR